MASWKRAGWIVSARFDRASSARYNSHAHTSHGLDQYLIQDGGLSVRPRQDRATINQSIHESILASGNRLRIPSGEALSPIAGDRTVNDRAAINAFPGVENEEEV